MDDILKCLDERAAQLRGERKRLNDDARADEGNLMEIRANVCGICKAMLQALPEDKAMEKIRGLGETWGAALVAARDRDDAQRAAVETTKLEMLDEIMALLRPLEV